MLADSWSFVRSVNLDYVIRQQIKRTARAILNPEAAFRDSDGVFVRVPWSEATAEQLRRTERHRLEQKMEDDRVREDIGRLAALREIQELGEMDERIEREIAVLVERLES